MSNSSFVLSTDSSCDMPPQYLAENEILTMQLSIIIDGESYFCNELDPKEFYQMMREGVMPTSAQVNVDQIANFFEPVLQEGKDILHLSFSSGLSGTCNNALLVAKELSEKYPERKIYAIDTLCASLGQGLLLYKVNELKQAGKSIDEIAKWAQDHVQNIAHYVSVDDLMHLHRGGRVSKASAVVGTVLGIKPIIRMNETGHLEVIDKARGRKQAMESVLRHLDAAVGDTPNDICFICHADCEGEAKEAAKHIKERYGVESIINYVGPVIGAHTGPGCYSIFLMAQHR